MKAALFLPLVLSLSLVCSGRSLADEISEMILRPPQGGDYFDVLGGVDSVGDDQFIAVGYRGSVEGFRCWIVRALAPGRVAWAKSPCAEPGAMLWDVTRLSGGDYLAVGYLQAPTDTSSDGFAIRFDAEGNPIWQRRYRSHRHERLYFGVELDGGDLAVGGRSAVDAGKESPTNGLVLILDSADGRQIRRFSFSSSRRERAAFLDGVQVADGALILVGFETDEGTGRDDVWILKAGIGGSRIWEHRYGGEGDDLGHGAVPLPHSGVGVFGWGTRSGSDHASGLFLELDRDGSLVRQRSYAAGPGGNDRFRDAIMSADGQFLVAGQASFSREAPNRGWFLQLSAAGDPIRDEVLTSLSPGRLYGIALSPSGAVKAVGLSVPQAGHKPDAWLVDLSGVTAARAPSADVELRFDASASRGCREIPAGDLDSVCTFRLHREARVWVSLLPSSADLDLTLTDASGDIVGLSDNRQRAAELVEANLGPGEHVVRTSRFREDGTIAPFRLRVGVARGPDDASATGDDETLTHKDRIAVEHALDLVGYAPGPVDGLFTASTWRSIRALQAALGEEPDGGLTPGQRLHLAVFAALAAEHRAREVADFTEHSVEGARLSRREEATIFGRPGILVVKLVEGRQHGFFDGAGDFHYVGTWSQALQPEGLGVTLLRQEDRIQEWAGEVSAEGLGRYGVALVDGVRVEIGEVESNRGVSYGIVRDHRGRWSVRTGKSDAGAVAFQEELFEDL